MKRILAILASAVLAASFFTIAGPAPAPADAACLTNARVIFYENVNFGGRSVSICADYADLNIINITACGKTPVPANGWSDCPSSMKWNMLGSGVFELCIYRDTNFRNSEIVIGAGSQGQLANLGSLNDTFSSTKWQNYLYSC